MQHKNMDEVKVWEENIIIPTYEIGQAEKNPIFLDKRVYQGSCGKVYPYPTIESISDTKVDKEYKAVWLENEYLKIMVLPELGGRIQRAYDKTNGYDFVYYNKVIKPALVGLTGPWISGGIEFNWPQHHRPTTFLPVDYVLQENEDGSKSILVHDVDQMYGTKGLAKFTLYPGKAYLEIRGQLYNRTSLPQTFLWWANPAVAVNEYTQSVFPPDVHAVMDHGKRDVSRFPIATGVYYKKDYSEGVDISRYKNIPVPTSYMAEKSKYDFVGGYDYSKEAGILHVADHHISPGKKQWTWGCGDFGRAWDRNLTDEDGPYVELMTGVYTDNQPDFTWLKPFEEKTFVQYFMPYKAVGQVKNATIHAAIGMEMESDNIVIKAYATSVRKDAKLIISYDGEVKYTACMYLAPDMPHETTVSWKQISEKKKEQRDWTKLQLMLLQEGQVLVSYQPEEEVIPELPEPAKAALPPQEIMTNEELYLTGLHLEQYRHATYQTDAYYLEGLKRDPKDIRINNAYGALLMRRGQFEKAESYFRTAIERLTWKNPNPYDSEAYYLLGLVLFYQERLEEAYDAFYKATWSNEQQEMSFYYLAAIDAQKGQYTKAYEHIEKSLVKNAHHIKARGLKAYILRKMGLLEEAKCWILENLQLDPFDFVSAKEQIFVNEEQAEYEQTLVQKLRGFEENYLMLARDYAEFGAYEEAIEVLQSCKKAYPLLAYYAAFYTWKKEQSLTGQVQKLLQQAQDCISDYCFPNKLEDIAVLRFALAQGNASKAAYYLGNLFYDKQQWQEAISLWEQSKAEDDCFATVHRNLALAYYNKEQQPQKAQVEMEKAFALNQRDVRIFLELDQLYRKRGMSFEDRLARYEQHKELIAQRDDLYIEYITLLNMTGAYEKAYECIQGHHFHPWEGGEGKITTQYTLCLLQMAKELLGIKGNAKLPMIEQIPQENAKKAEALLKKALVYPENLGEGKLEGTKDNHLYYYLGIVCKAQGKDDEAQCYFEQAIIGTDEPAGAMYYNDQPADMILYQGLAFLQLGKEKEAKARFYRLIDYGERHVKDKVAIEYFAVSLPDFLIFEDDLTKRNAAHCNYLMGLGNIGLGQYQKAAEFLQRALHIETSHMMSHIYLFY